MKICVGRSCLPAIRQVQSPVLHLLSKLSDSIEAAAGCQYPPAGRQARYRPFAARASLFCPTTYSEIADPAIPSKWHSLLAARVLVYIVVKPTVYIETSVISYLTSQASRDVVVAAHQQLTAEWWQRALPQFEPFVSLVVLEEIARGDPQAASRRQDSVAGFGVLEVSAEVRNLAERYFAAIDIPERARADAYHLALAVWHGMDYLLT